MATYTITTDAASMTIEARDANQAATKFCGYPCKASELQHDLKEAGGYGHMSRDGVELWRVSASAK